MAMNQKERDVRRKEKEAKTGAQELRFKALQGEKDMVLDLMNWTDDTEQASVITHCIRLVHSYGREGARKALSDMNARHKFVISNSWGARFEEESLRELRRDPGDKATDNQSNYQSTQ